MEGIIVYLSLGSNVGDRMAYLTIAQDALTHTEGITLLARSSIYETEPWGKGEAGPTWFLNQCLKIETTLLPIELLAAVEHIEHDMGREQKGDQSPRPIDIDILLYGDQVIDLPTLQIPHRHMTDRQFVLVPLVELEPTLKDPVTHNLYSFYKPHGY